MLEWPVSDRQWQSTESGVGDEASDRRASPRLAVQAREPGREGMDPRICVKSSTAPLNNPPRAGSCRGARNRQRLPRVDGGDLCHRPRGCLGHNP
jgi:hypothetical protein